MRSLHVVFLVLLAVPAAAAECPTVRLSEPEDATSVHHYLFEFSGNRVERVVWIWNGGVQNTPEVVEYRLGSGRIVVSRGTLDRGRLARFEAGGSPDFDRGDSYSVDSRTFAPIDKESLSASWKVDIANLIDILARRRPSCR